MGPPTMMALTLRQLEYLLAVAEHRSFTRAASALYVSQPALSQQLSQLEHTLQVKLIDRTSREIRLTPAGRVYVEHAARALGELHWASRALDEFEDLSRGEVRIGLIPPALVLVGPALVAFNARYPGIKLTLLEKDLEDIHNALSDGVLDLGIGFDRSELRAGSDSGIDSNPLQRPSVGLLVGNQHPWFGRTHPVAPDELAEQRFVLLSPRFALRQYVDTYCGENGLSLQASMEVDSIAMITEAVSDGQLCTFCFTALADRGDLTSVPMDPPLATPRVLLLCRGRSTSTLAARAVVASLLDADGAIYQAPTSVHTDSA